MQNNCVVCGQVFESPRKKQCCSQQCYYRRSYSPDAWAMRPKKWDVTCKVCGGPFKTNKKSQLYCSVQCRAQVQRRVPSFTCKNCDRAFSPIGMDRTTFCSRECTFSYKTKHRAITIKKASQQKTCSRCGKPFESNKPNRRFCSKECREYRIPKDPITYVRQCKECGKQFDTSSHGIGFCSDQCRRKYRNRYDYVRSDKRLTQNGRRDYSITLARLYLRDKGVCYLCGQQVNMDANPNANDYGSIDHVTPVSKGGQHTWGNVRLAHRKCNMAKLDHEICAEVCEELAASA